MCTAHITTRASGFDQQLTVLVGVATRSVQFAAPILPQLDKKNHAGDARIRKSIVGDVVAYINSLGERLGGLPRP